MALESISVVVGNELDKAERGTALNVPMHATHDRGSPLFKRDAVRGTRLRKVLEKASP